MAKEIFFVIVLIFIGIIVGVFSAFALIRKSPAQTVKNKSGVELVKEEKQKQSESSSEGGHNEKMEIMRITDDKTKTSEIKKNNENKAEIEITEVKNTNPEENVKKIQKNKEQQKQGNSNIKTKKVAKKKTKGKWYFVNYNKEYYDIDEVGDDVSEIKINDVCEENKGVTTFCEREEDLRKSTTKNLGKEVCGGGGECKVGQSCLLWYDDTQDNGDVELKTATYKCE